MGPSEGPLLVRGARQLLTLRGARGTRRGSECQELAVINDGSILIDGGRIVSVGPSRRIENLAAARSARVLEVHGAVVMPGFIDSHAHKPDNPAGAARMVEFSRRHGTVAMEIKADWAGLRTLAQLAGDSITVVPTLMSGEWDEEAVRRTARRGAAQFADLHPDDEDPWKLRAAKEAGLKLRIHAGARPHDDRVTVAIALGAASVDHLDHLDDAQTRLIASSSTVATIMPGASRAARNLIDAGAAVALATGFDSRSGSTCSMFAAIAPALREKELTPAEAIVLTTVNPAHSLGLGHRLGTIEADKDADILILGISDYREMDQYCGVNLIDTIIKSGRIQP